MAIDSPVGLQIGRRPKTTKGTVKVEVDKGWLRLRFSQQGKRHTFALGLPDSKTNRILAEQKALQIQKDVEAGHFDDSLARYKPERQKNIEQEDKLSAIALFRDFSDYKAKGVTPKTMEKYRATLNYVEQFFQGVTAQAVTEEEVEAFVRWQKRKNLSEAQIKRRLEELEACWNWHHMSDNPWKAISDRIKVPPKQRPKPFTKEEIDAIIRGFSEDQDYAFYTDFVRFLFWTGCRTGEAIGLRWKHLGDDCLTIWIGEILTRRVLRPAKRNKDRSFSLNSKVQALLLSRKPQDAKPDDLVFPSPEGVGIDDHNFSQRIWRKMLKRLSIPYRKFYNTRHTYISHVLQAGMNPILVAEIAGHDVETLLRCYAGVVSHRLSLPEI
ncbi:MAG: tyrosine-type recombinase/integrase [Leptolyngbyaceae cyanobacterium bins.302]|nr:tyrosine-type recombinase/integrase [Leptolyngbyaceae cyanobacterium bins.302]